MYLYIRSYYMGGLTIAQKAIKGSHMYKCNITYRYGFILRWNPRIYNMCRQALAHEQENFNNFPCSGIFGDFRGFRTGGLFNMRPRLWSGESARGGRGGFGSRGGGGES